MNTNDRLRNIKAPVTYQGGKQRLASKIVDIITNGKIEGKQFVDLCCGSGAISIELVNRGVPPSSITMVDNSCWGEFWNQAGFGEFDIQHLEKLLNKLPQDRNKIQDTLKAWAAEPIAENDDIVPKYLILQAGSFGGKQIWTDRGAGKWITAGFRSYWQPTASSSRRYPVNPMHPMPETIKKQIPIIVERMKGVVGLHEQVENFDWSAYETRQKTSEVVVYIDPPYNNTTRYGFQLDYTSWIKTTNLPEGYTLWITDYMPHGAEFYSFGKTKKGGIAGGKKTRQEFLSRVK